MEMSMGPQITEGDGPLYSRTWSLDQAEGQTVESMRHTHANPYPEPVIQVPQDLERNLVVTSVDALLNWGGSRRCGQWPLDWPAAPSK